MKKWLILDGAIVLEVAALRRIQTILDVEEVRLLRPEPEE